MTTTMTKNQPTVTIEKLTEIAKEFLRKEYNLPLIIPIRFNNRLSRTLGWFKLERRGSVDVPKVIELSTKLLTYYTDEEIIDILKHELVHYALFMLGKPFKDGHWCFENELMRLGINPTKTYRYRGKIHVYGCKKCRQVVAERTRRTKLNQKYETACCHADIVYMGTKIV